MFVIRHREVNQFYNKGFERVDDEQTNDRQLMSNGNAEVAYDG